MTAFHLETLILLLTTQIFSSFGNNGIAALHEDGLAKEGIDWDPRVHFTSHTDKGEAIPIKIRRSMGKIMTNRTMNILGFSRVSAVLLKPLHSDSVSSHPSYWFLYVFPSLPPAASSEKQPSENKGYISALTKAQAHTETKAHTHFRYVCALIAPAHAYTWLERQGLRPRGAD